MSFQMIPNGVSLHTKLMLTLIILITLIMGSVGYVIIKQERNNRLLYLENRADGLVELASHSLAYSIWNIDLLAIDDQITSLINDPEVVECSVTAVGYGTLIEVNESLEPLFKPIIRTKSIYFNNEETGIQNIGEIRIVMTRKLVEKDIFETQRSLLVMMLVILIVMYAATYVFLRLIVSQPINRIGIMVDRISLGDLNARCIVESEDELGLLANRVNTMADQLGHSNRSLRDSENRLQLVLDGSQLGYWDWNIVTGEVVRNALWGQMLGFTLDEIKLTVKHWSDLQHPDDREQAWKSIVDHLEGRSKSHKIEYRMRTKDGNYKWILDQAKIVSWDDDGKPLRMCGTHTDITERKLVEEEKDRVQIQLAQSQKMESLGQLTGGIAHDFNNMLNGIINAAQLLKNPKRKLDKHGVEITDLILQASSRATELIKKLLAFSRKTGISLTPVNLHEIIDDSVNILANSIDKKIKITTAKNADMFRIIGDHSTLENILINLGINSSHAMENGGFLQFITENIYVDQTYCDSSSFNIQSGEVCKISVVDSGKGIPSENLQKIFEPFFTTKEQGKGTGLGLSAVYGAIKDLHGEIIVESELEVGTTFSILLPCLNESVEDNYVEKTLISNDELKTQTILFVDDNDINRILGKEILESLGYSIILSENGKDAVDIFKIKHSEIDLIIMDMTMPLMNGSEAFYLMREIDKKCKVIISSGNITSENVGELEKSGLSGSIQKPFTILELKEKVDEILK